ncbi:MAG: gamma-D-glutamyl-meso-diaminopimelate peptidase [Clostridiales bacterium]|nr:gamma-D-glutamyl-meso-diaminopimelate peptidase [Clostridiales bacterium]
MAFETNFDSKKNPNCSSGVLAQCRALKTDFPYLRMGVAGYSVMGKCIPALYLGNGERRVLFCAAHHANEWLTSIVLLNYIRSLCENGDIGGYTACFVPLLNPDGMDIVSGALCSGPYFEEAAETALRYPHIPFPSGWKANIRGVDLNLQYPARWEKAKMIKAAGGYNSPSPRDFAGFCPLSEPESRALAELTENFLPHVAISLHSQGEVIYYSHAGAAPEGARQLGEKMAAAGGYQLEITPAESDNAGYKDWVIARFGVSAYTIELGLGENPLPISELESICRRAFPMLQITLDGV